ncbi:hypothetical protein BsWGS_28632 [Bradybaena similaris]
MAALKTAAAVILFNMIVLLQARQKHPRLDHSNTIKTLKQAAQDTDTVVNTISEAWTDRRGTETGEQSVGERLIKEELDMLSEDARKLRDKMLNKASVYSVSRPRGETLEDDLKSIQSDAAYLYKDAEDLISDAHYNRKQIKTHTDLAFDRDLQRLRNQTGRVLEQVRGIGHPGTDKSSIKKNVRRRKHRRKDKLKGSTEVKGSLDKQSRSNEVMVSDVANSSPLWRDPRCEEMLHGRLLDGRNVQPEALTVVRPRGNAFDVSWMMCYLQACPHCTVTTQGGQCPLTNRVLEMQKWANELQEVLTHGCVKPAGCTSPGTCCIAADSAIEQTVAQVTDMLKNLYDMFSKKCAGCYEQQDNLGSWAAWSEWSSCDATCAPGTRSRFRRCPSGQTCPGSSLDSQPCPGLPDCCVEGSWSSWDQWGTCSATCGRGQTTRSRRCARPPTNGCVKPCVGASDDARVCDAATPCCVDGNWATWSRWSACSSSCGGRRTRTRTCSNPPPSSCGRGCPGELQQIESCSDSVTSVNGNWGSWQAWAGCSASCGAGFRSRRRACDNPRPGPCGRPCVGSESQTDACDSGISCCVDGGWSLWEGWGSCSVTCGRGQSTRRRRCSRPAPNFCGKQCAGEREESRVCEAGSECCEDATWGSWSRWSACSSSCGDGRRTRTRACSNSPFPNCGRAGCQGDTQQAEPCSDSGLSVNGNWGSWQAWTSCSASCGAGFRSRRRACDSPRPGPCGRPCVGSESQTDACDTGISCCVDGSWGPWQAWSACSATCDIGSMQRFRSCDNPPANHCGAKCQGEELEMTACNTGVPCRRCEVKEWTSWGSWSSCSATCGAAVRRRSRSCAVVVAGSDCGSDCPGRAQEELPCMRLPDCPIDGSWGPWQPWAQCSVTCGRGVKERRRLCDNPPTSESGQRCPGRDYDRQPCESAPCPVCVDGNWGVWGRWSPCSVTCDTGIRERRRSCDNPPANECGQSCPGRDFDTNVCDTGTPCLRCVDGNWGVWGRWSPCSATCDTGTRERRRSCDNPPANECGQSCPGRDFDTNVCDTGTPCLRCVDGNWGVWGPWSTCSATCDKGTIERTRSCDNPPANECGQSCPGRDFDTNVCDTGTPCLRCVDGNWGVWGRWSPCSATCDTGTRERRRSCDNPPANECGQSCPGRDFDTNVCDTGTPCLRCVDGNWGVWGPWSTCSVTCEKGTIERRRSCDNPPANECGQSCPGREFDTNVCDTGTACLRCVNGGWSSWGSWSACPAPCGDAVVERRRNCNNPAPSSCGVPCPGAGEETKLERCGPPEIDGNWGVWGRWSPCSVTCNTGTRERRRSCDNPPANECGQSCPGREFDTNVCDTGTACLRCVNGGWGSWSSWSACPAPCGDAVVERRRNCNNPAPSSCGVPCPGAGEETKLERCGPPEIVGQWSQWTTWSSCSASCGIGSILRSRTCSNPPPVLCGTPCPGHTDERKTCTGSGLCDCEAKDWTTWGPWSGCSATCGSASRSRSRSCVVVRTGNDCGADCPGNSREDGQCIGLPGCPTIGQWSAWSSCSATCRGRGVRERFITTTIIIGGDMSEAVNETRRETEFCEVTQPECPVYGQWSPCSATCRGQGIRERIVSTSSGDIGTGGVSVGTNATRKEIEVCQVLEPECPIWGQWSPCSATCRGQGIRERIVSTSSGDIGTGGVSVGTNATRKEVEVCQVLEPQCPIWGEWSACSVTCRGQGVRERIISTSRIVGTGATPVETDAVRKEVEECFVSEPECLYGDASWASWDSWCPCDCRQGIRTRRRDCEKPNLLGETAQKVPIALCQGEARDEEGCDTRLQCPECVSDCQGKPPGNYPSCTDCVSYMSCQENGNGIDLQCTPANTEWDAFVKSCVTAPSPSCTLHDCVDSCQDKTDGTYHSCAGCHSYVECTAGRLTSRLCPELAMSWNQHTRRCERQKSPTCKVSTRRSSIPGGGFQRDAVNLAGSSDKHGRRATDVTAHLQKTAQEDWLKTGINDPLLTSSVETRRFDKTAKLKSTQVKEPNSRGRDGRTIPNCKRHCRDAKEGKYPSCRGCDHYVVCTRYKVLQEQRCPGGRHWDDHKKGCRSFSSTCSNNR